MATWLNVVSITQSCKEMMHIVNSFAMCHVSQEGDVAGSFLCQQGSAKEHYIHNKVPGLMLYYNNGLAHRSTPANLY
jgi:hypothetical protein